MIQITDALLDFNYSIFSPKLLYISTIYNFLKIYRRK